jgi:hypothetical protein
MRDGTRFTVAHATVDYERICTSGTYSNEGDPEKMGLRLSPESSQSPHVIAWADIGSIDFGERTGRVGGYCGDLPHAVMASVHLKAGSTVSRALLDTTDAGIAGVSERGPIVIPLREVKTLRTIDDGGWAWVAPRELDANERMRRLSCTVLDVAPGDGSPAYKLRTPEIVLSRTKTQGNPTVLVSYRDGHSEELIVRRGRLIGDSAPVGRDIGTIVRIAVTVELKK